MRKWFLIAVCICFVACDPIHSPYIRNEASTPVLLSISYKDQPVPSIGTLQPLTNLGHGGREQTITKLEARLNSGKVFVLDEAELQARRTVADDGFEFWLITDHGVSLKSEEEWKRHRARK